MTVFVDTNVLVYAFDHSEPSKRDRARLALESLDAPVVSTQVLLELYAVLTRKLRPPVEPGVARQVVATLVDWRVVGADARLVERAVATSIERQVSIWDAMVIEAAAEAQCDELWTEDLATGSTVRGVRIVNPFET